MNVRPIAGEGKHIAPDSLARPHHGDRFGEAHVLVSLGSPYS